MTRLSELIKLAVLTSEAAERETLRMEEIREKQTARKIHLLSEMVKVNVNIN